MNRFVFACHSNCDRFFGTFSLLLACGVLSLSAEFSFAQTAATSPAKLAPDLGQRQTGVDWPVFLGPTGDSKSSETGIISPWPAEGLKVVWDKPLAESYCIGSISRGRLLQPDYDDGTAILYCWNAETGQPIWKFTYPSDYQDMYGYNSGPRCSPVIDENRIYLLGVEGMLHCLDLNDGAVIWKVDTNKTFGVIQNFFGVGSTPVVHGELLIAMIGGSPQEDHALPPGALDRATGNGSGIVAFDKRTGQIRYKFSDELASYASLKLAKIGSRDWCFAFARGGLIGFEPAAGKQDLFFPWRASILESVNASVPVVVGNQVFISETYGPGSALLKVSANQDAQVVWQDSDRSRTKAMQTHWNTAIHHDGYLYGCSGRHLYNAELRCIDWKTGKVQWSEPELTRTSLLYIDNHFICLGEDGTLRLLKANPDRYEEISNLVLRTPESAGVAITDERTDQQTRLIKYPAWAAPIVSHGLLYVRGKDRLVCLELIPK